MVVVVLVFIREGDRILLVQQDYGQRYWSLPGGVVEAGETLVEAAAREVWEEQLDQVLDEAVDPLPGGIDRRVRGPDVEDLLGKPAVHLTSPWPFRGGRAWRVCCRYILAASTHGR